MEEITRPLHIGFLPLPELHQNISSRVLHGNVFVRFSKTLPLAKKYTAPRATASSYKLSYFLSCLSPRVLPVKILMALRDEVKLALHTAAPLLRASKVKF